MISKSDCKTITALIVFILCAIAIAPVMGAMSGALQNTDLFGTNIGRGNVVLSGGDGMAQCLAMCEADSSCQGATYVQPGIQGASAYCWIKSDVAYTIANQPCCISWLRLGTGAACRASFSCDKYTGPAPLTVHCHDESDDCTSWFWELPDGGEPDRYNAQAPPAFIFDTPGTYRVQLSASGSTNTDDDEKTITVRSTTGSLSVTSTPGGATVTIDGVYAGTTSAATPVTKTGLSAGSHTVVLSLDGYSDATKTVTIAAEQTLPLAVTLTKSTPTTGALNIITDPEGASVSLDGGSKGTTPLTISEIYPGTYTLKITKSGYTDLQQSVTISAGKETKMTVSLTKAGTTTKTTTKTTTTTTKSSDSTGQISISSSPSGASINLDGYDKGKTPATIQDVKAGSHTLALSLDGYEDYTKTIPVEAGKITTIKATLTQKGSQPTGEGSLTILSTPTGANVYIDGEKIGTSPVKVQGVQAGSHKVLLTMQGYGDIAKTVDVPDGSDKEVEVVFADATKTPGFGAFWAIGAFFGVLVLWRKRG